MIPLFLGYSSFLHVSQSASAFGNYIIIVIIFFVVVVMIQILHFFNFYISFWASLRADSANEERVIDEPPHPTVNAENVLRHSIALGGNPGHHQAVIVSTRDESGHHRFHKIIRNVADAAVDGRLP